MTDSYDDRRLEHAASLWLIALIFVRWGFAGQPFFRGEFVGEDFILLLILTFHLVPARFKRLIRCLAACLMSVMMMLLAWTGEARKAPSPHDILPAVFFGLFAIYTAARIVGELSTLRRNQQNGPPERHT